MSADKMKIIGTTLAVQVADRLRDEILARKIKPGTRITTKEVADKYGVSNVPVREAFNLLCGENLMENLPYKGVVVKDITPEFIKETIELLYALEVLLIEISLEKGYSAAVIVKLKRINEEMEALANSKDISPDKRLDINTRFHLTLYSPCKGHLAYELYEKNLQHTSVLRKYYPVNFDRIQETAREHEEILDAIEKNDLQAALDATRRHSKNSKTAEIQFVDNN